MNTLLKYIFLLPYISALKILLYNFNVNLSSVESLYRKSFSSDSISYGSYKALEFLLANVLAQYVNYSKHVKK